MRAMQKRPTKQSQGQHGRPRLAPQQVRIIGGEWKRRLLPVLDALGLRPTPDRVRETLFNWLASLAGVGGGELPGWHCLDAFAGTGALGLEAAFANGGNCELHVQCHLSTRYVATGLMSPW